MSEKVTSDLSERFKNGIFFAIHDQPFDRLHYASACLMEGFKELAIPAFCNCSIPGMEVRGFDPLAYDLYVFNVTERSANGPLLPFVEKFHRKEKILLSMSDTSGVIFPSPGYKSLMTHENKFLKITGNRIPWVFGISNEILEATKQPPDFEERGLKVLRNFRPSTNQDVRNALDFSFVEVLKRFLPVDETIGSDHFERLLSSVACLAYGGSFRADMAPNPYFAEHEYYKTIRENTDFKQPIVIARWDSWRFWESLAAGCLTFHLDFEKYGFLLPEMPTPWKHYIPIDMADPVGSVERFMDSRASWAEIAYLGREWALEHYSPAACARRLLQIALQEDKTL